MTISETTDRVQAIGREFLKPMPDGWTYTLSELACGTIFVCTAIRGRWYGTNWPERSNHEARGEAPTPDEARRLCREEAERKSKS